MATAEAETSHHDRASPGGSVYDGFISYSHAADDLLAPRLQAGLQRFAKPWWKRRALRIFRDESSLSANPHLWSSITDALDLAEWFVLLLSPEAAESPWVNNEVEYWLANKDTDKIIPVLTDGEFGWADGDVTGDAFPPALAGAFSDEPRWVDLRFARTEEQLDLKSPTFSAAVADVASAIRGVPKDELESEEVLQHRRTTRTAWAAGIGLVVLLAVSVVAAIFALDQQNEAEQLAASEAEARSEADANAAQADENAAEAAANAAEADTQRIAAEHAEALAVSREMAASAIAVVDTDPELATLLAIEAIDRTPSDVPQPVEVINALWQAGSANRLVDVFATGHESNISLSPDGTRLATTTDLAEIQVMDAATGESLWSYTEETADFFAIPAFSADGRVAISVIDSTAEAVPQFVEEHDELPNRILVLDAATGDLLKVLEFPWCAGADLATWSPDAAYLAVGSGQNACLRDGVPFWLEVYDTATWEAVAFLPIESLARIGPVPRFDDAGRLYALLPWSPFAAFEAGTFEQRPTSGATGIGDVAPDGSQLVLSNSEEEHGTEFSARTFDTESGDVVDVLYTGASFPSVPLGIMVSSDARYAIVGTTGATTSVFNVSTGVEEFRLPTGSINTLGYDPATERLYTASALGDVRVWDLGASAVGVDATGDLGSFTWVNGNSFAIGPELAGLESIDIVTGEWAVRFFDPISGTMEADSVADGWGPRALANGKFVVGVYGNASRVLWDPATAVGVDLLPCETPGVDSFGDALCVGEGEPEFYEVSTSVDGTEILAFGGGADALTGEVVALDPESGAVIDVEVVETTIPRFDVFTEAWGFGPGISGNDAVERGSFERLHSGPFGSPIEASVSARLIALGEGATTLVVLDTETWEEIVTMESSARIRGLAFDRDEERIAVGTLDSLLVVDLATGVIVQQLRLPGVSDIHWLDDETVLVGTNTGIFGTLSLSIDAFLDRTSAALRRSFTAQECLTYRIDPCPTLDEIQSR